MDTKSPPEAMHTEFGPLPARLAHEVMIACTDIGGWCPVQKGWLMAALILREKPQTVVEVGVYRGRSAISQALAVAHNGTGIVYAVDAWEAAPTQYGSGLPPTELWWKENDFEEDYKVFTDEVDRRKLNRWMEVMRAESLEAVKEFEPAPCIDVLHVDANHGEQAALEDVTAWLPKVRPGGWIWLDDVDWTTVRPAYNYIAGHCDKIKDWDRYSLFRTRTPVDSTTTAG